MKWWLVMYGKGWDLSTPLQWDTGWRLSRFWLDWSSVRRHGSPMHYVHRIAGHSRSVSSFSTSLPSSLPVPFSTAPYLPSSQKLFPLLPTLPCTLSPVKFFLCLYQAPAPSFLILAHVSCTLLLFKYSVFPSVHILSLLFSSFLGFMYHVKLENLF